MNKLIAFFSVIIFSSQLIASSINLEIHYQEAQSGTTVRREQSATLSDSVAVSNSGMHKTLFAIKLSQLLKSTLIEYHASQNHWYDIYPREPIVVRPCPCPVPDPKYWEEIRRQHAQTLLANFEKLEKIMMPSFAADADIAEVALLVKKLADNMIKGEVGPSFERIRPPMKASNSLMRAAGGLNVTAGGLKDYSHFKKQLEDGFVPVAEAFIEEGFLSSLTLSLEGGECRELICLQPAYAFDKESRKLFVQVGMNSNVTPESFKRPPLNLSFVIDISGSMAGTDFTERTRLEWAKDAVVQSILNLNENDTVSLVVFDSISEVLLQPTLVTDKSLIINKVQTLQPRNSTNLYAGLRDGFLLASLAFREDCQNRVILFSDAGLNTGVTDQSSILRLVSDYAGENIGLTAIGVGENFHHDFIHKITMSKGGNALFVHTGKDMMKFFKNFDYLVAPVAYNFKLTSTLQGINAKLVKAYGVPMRKDEPIQELINVRTLFFSEEGGAIVLEYDLL